MSRVLAMPQLSFLNRQWLFLWYIGTPDSFHSIAERFGISKSAAHCTWRRISKTIINNLMRRMIRWPSAEKRQQIISEGFAEYCIFPGTIGAIDGCHIRIKAQEKLDNPVSYINRNKFHYAVLHQCLHWLAWLYP